MKIAILSDTHDNQANVISCLESIKLHSINTVIHCGDFINPGMVNLFSDLKLIYVYGNCDLDIVRIHESVMEVGKDNYAGLNFSGKLGGKHILALHGNVEGSLMEAVQSRSYDYIFRGHSHLHSDQMHFNSRVINPGALGGLKREKRSFCILDIATDQLDFIYIPDL